MSGVRDAAPHLYLVAGETSGDILGGKLMAALRAAVPGVRFSGVGGESMTGQGLHSLFAMSDIAVMGFVPVIKRLPALLRRIRETAEDVIAQRPDALVIIDSPDFTHRVAKIVRKHAPDIPVINYVSPTVWAWREGRARKMRGYIDHVLAVLPFEPAAHQRLGGPPCTYVGHPLIARLDLLRPNAEEQLCRDQEINILILPGSRNSEVNRLMPVFGAVAARIAAAVPDTRFQLPVVAHVSQNVQAHIAQWPVKPVLLETESAKFAAFRRARAALAASGTVTLELGLAQVPMVTAYKVSPVEKWIIKMLVKVSTAILPSIILGRKVVPELLQEEAVPDKLSAALLPVLRDGLERQAQLAAFAELDVAMQVPGGDPSATAAQLILNTVQGNRSRNKKSA